MARPLRIEFAGGLYHVTSRGDARADIYRDEEDRLCFLEVLAQVIEQHNWVLHAYCLMGNHYHLLLETPDGNLARGMRQLNGVYTQRFNRRHRRVGHLFQGRYKAIIVQKESYLLELARYIVLNPVRAGMVRRAGDWPWSNYRATAGQSARPGWLAVDPTLASFGRSRNQAREHYRRFVSEGKNQPSPWHALRNQVFLGSDAFVANMQRKIETDADLSEIPKAQRRPLPKPIEFYERRAKDRDAAIVSAYASGGYTLKEIGTHFDLHYSRVSRIVAEAKGKT